MKKLTLTLAMLFVFAAPAYSQSAEEWLIHANNAKSLKKKIEFTSEALKLKPSLPAAYKMRGQARFEWGDFQSAEEDFTKCLELGEMSCLADRAAAFTEKGDLQKAADDLTRALSLDPVSEAYLYIQRGRLYERLGDPAAAEADFQKARQAMPQVQNVELVSPPFEGCLLLIRWTVRALACLMILWGLKLADRKAAVTGTGKETVLLRFYKYAAGFLLFCILNLLFFMFIGGFGAVFALVFRMPETLYYGLTGALLLLANLFYFKRDKKKRVQFFNVERADASAALKSALHTCALDHEDLGETIRLKPSGVKIRMLFSDRLKLGLLEIENARQVPELRRMTGLFGEALGEKKLARFSPAALFNWGCAAAALLAEFLLPR